MGKWLGKQLKRGKQGLKAGALKLKKYGLSYAEYLASMGRMGNSSFERALEYVARKEGRPFDEAQVYRPSIGTPGGYTIVDFVRWGLMQAIYADGIWHRLDPNRALVDMLQDWALQEQGFDVVRIPDTEFYAAPERTVAKYLPF